MKNKIWASMHNNYRESEPYFNILGYFLIISYMGFYFFNKLVTPTGYENFFIRLVIRFCGLLLILQKQWPSFLVKLAPLFFYFVVLFSFPFFFIFMLLNNQDSSIWHLCGLVGFVLLSFFVDWISFTILSLLGIAIAILCTNAAASNSSLISIFSSYTVPILYFALFSHKRRLLQKEQENINNQLELKVQERTIALEEALAAKTEFLNNISHEIRTPIQGFTVISAGLVEYWQDFDEKKRLSLAETIAHNAKRLADLMTNLLDLAKLKAKKMILNYQETDLVLIIEDIINECKDLYIHDKNIKIIFIKPNKAPLTGDKERIGQVIRNLLVNAIKFSPNNSIITVNLVSLNNQWHFSITDHGLGLPEAEINNIFEPFIQSSRTKTGAGGTGLGLSICKSIIEAHNGKIWAENNLDKGASFHFIIPISCASNNVIIKSELKILMIDDEESCLTSMELLLLDTNYTLLKASSGPEGIEFLMSNPNIDIILLDLMMPGMSGIETLIEIKNNPELANIPIILQSGTSEENEIAKAYKLGIVSFIKKPYDKKTVLKHIANAYITK